MINYFVWLQQPNEIRLKLAETFGMKKSTGVHVVNSQVECDGFTSKDIYNGLTIDKMQRYSGLPSKDAHELFMACVKKAQEFIVPETKKPEPITPEITSEPKRRGRPKKV